MRNALVLVAALAALGVGTLELERPAPPRTGKPPNVHHVSWRDQARKFYAASAEPAGALDAGTGRPGKPRRYSGLPPNNLVPPMLRPPRY